MTSAYGKIQHTSCSPEFKWQLAVSWPITDTMRSFRVSPSLRPHPFSPVIARVEPALAWNQTLKSLCLSWKRILPDTRVRFHQKHSIVLGVSYTELATLGTNLFSRPWSYKLQKCPGFSIPKLLLVKGNVMCHKFQPQIVHRKRSIFIHYSYT